MTIALHTGDCRDLLRNLPDESVHCVVTSPPYWGLRDYGVVGQLGLEASPDIYVAAMVEVFREVRRVLRKDGTLWLNLGDSYASGGRGGGANGSKQQTNSGSLLGAKEPPDGLKPKDLCGIPWRVAFALQQPYYAGKIKNEMDRVWLAAMIDAEGCIFIHKRKAGGNHDTFTKKDGAVSQYQRQRDMYGSGLEVSNTSRTIVERCMAIAGIGSICEQSPEQNHRRKQKIYRWNVRSNECRWILQEVYPHLVAKRHQARLAIGCPSFGDEGDKAHTSLMALHNGEEATIDFPSPTVMFEPGFYLRQDIIWAKKNCMPESVTDRCTKAHEYLFLLSKSERYFYDAEAIREAHADPKGSGGWQSMARRGESGWHAKYPKAKVDDSRNDKESANAYQYGNGRNKRSVWEVTTQPFAEAHFATFPPALIEPCIKAGTSGKGCCAKCGAPWVRVTSIIRTLRPTSGPHRGGRGHKVLNAGIHGKGGTIDVPTIAQVDTLGWSPSCKCDAAVVPCTVLDPFAGAGTTGLVADRLQRNAILIELNAKYAEMTHKRIKGDAPLFAQIDYDGNDDFARSYEECLHEVRSRVATGGEKWIPK